MMTGGLLSTQNFSVKFGKVQWPTLVDSHVAREISILFLPTGADIKPEKAGEE